MGPWHEAVRVHEGLRGAKVVAADVADDPGPVVGPQQMIVYEGSAYRLVVARQRWRKRGSGRPRRAWAKSHRSAPAAAAVRQRRSYPPCVVAAQPGRIVKEGAVGRRRHWSPLIQARSCASHEGHPRKASGPHEDRGVEWRLRYAVPAKRAGCRWGRRHFSLLERRLSKSARLRIGFWKTVSQHLLWPFLNACVSRHGVFKASRRRAHTSKNILMCKNSSR